MFTIEEVANVLGSDQFRSDLEAARASLLAARLLGAGSGLSDEARGRITHFVEVVLACAPNWPESQRLELCRVAGELAESLTVGTDNFRSKLRAAMLHELADQPSVAAAIIPKQENAGLPSFLREFLRHEGAFRSISEDFEQKLFASARAGDRGDLSNLALCSNAEALLRYEQTADAPFGKLGTDLLLDGFGSFDVGLTATELEAASAVANSRASRATRVALNSGLFEALRKQHGGPVELFSAQRQALQEGLLDPKFDSWGFAAPTGSGKSFLTRILILDWLRERPDSRILYVVPSRALCSEVAQELEDAFEGGDIEVLSLSAQLVDLDQEENAALQTADVVILTPEKADMLLRLGEDFVKSVELCIVDEAHHLEAGTRGALLEMYLWRLRRALPRATFRMLSAVAPNIGQLVRWLGTRTETTTFLRRSTRMRAGVFRVSKGIGTIEYADGNSCSLPTRFGSAKKQGIARLAKFLGVAGPVLVVAKGKRECESLASEMIKLLAMSSDARAATPEDLASDTIKRLDSRLEREMYAEVAMREMLCRRVAYHHAGLPPRVRQSVERAIRERLVDYVFATTTLAEGVNFPFSSVIVESLVIQEPPEKGRPSRYHPVTPRSFWNIAGRAGRPGTDREGHAVLFEPTLGIQKVNIALDQYLSPDLDKLPPVRSALATGLLEVIKARQAGEIAPDDLKRAIISDKMSRAVHGALNLIRVGIVHSIAQGDASVASEMVANSFARGFLSDTELAEAEDVVAAQE